MKDDYSFCRSCGAGVFGGSSDKDGMAVAYTCLGEIFVKPNKEIRVMKECPSDGKALFAPSARFNHIERV